MNKKLDDYLQEGIYGAKEQHPEERRLFLGTLRERVELALTKGQVMRQTPYQIGTALQKNVKMLLNGDVAYSYLSPYIRFANEKKIPFTIVQNEKGNSPFGLVLTYDQAVDTPDIYIRDEIFHAEIPATLP
ncbi:YueI family protein [Ectobacillus sp. JY-23]|uniref:YueI family protein n=1 Tax=Ectobacillus sp. JY-23 TaxID=2933872 RepID=UPI001FF347CF|nr:YueI family protein [Ectobacillus sp. JY-23]UOY92936.1 YueI family protein [Ectobacillus sp. JY-23]